MTADEFVPLDECSSAADVAARLAPSGLATTPRQQTRLLALSRAGVRLSWAALEVALTEAPAALMSSLWLQYPLPSDALSAELQPAGLGLRARPDGVDLLSSDELWMLGQERGGALAVTQQAALEQVMVGGSGDDDLPASWRVVADAEDDSRILEQLRSGFRQAQKLGQNPAPLIWLALKRRRPVVTAEAARLVREHLDPDLGRHLEALFSLHPGTAAEALRSLQRLPRLDPAFLVGLLRILWAHAELRPAILALVAQLQPNWVERPELILDWWEELLAACGILEPEQVQTLAQATLDFGRAGVPVTLLLERRLERGVSRAERLLAGWLLAALGSTSDTLLEQGLALAREPHLSGQPLSRVQSILAALGESALDRLLEPALFAALEPDMRAWSVAQALESPAHVELGLARALDEVAEGSRRMLLELARLNLDLARLEVSDPALRQQLSGVLEAEIPFLEEPTESWAVRWHTRLDPEVLERLFRATRRDGESGSRSFPARLESWAKHCRLADHTPWPEQVELLMGLAQGQMRAEVGSAWALLAACRELDESVRQRLLLCLAELAAHFPEEWPLWWQSLQQSEHSPTRDRAEADLLGTLEQPDTPRNTLESCLAVTLACAERWAAVGGLLRGLSRRLLFAPPAPRPEELLRWALEAADEGDGTQRSLAWDATQREQALLTLGRLALRTDLDEGTSRAVRVRIWNFVLDWLDDLRGGRKGGSYDLRVMPLWSVCRALMPVPPGERNLCDRAAEAVFQLHDTAPDRLRLLTHGDLFGFLLDWALNAPEEDLAVAGERQPRLVSLMSDLLAGSDRDYKPVALGYLTSTPAERFLEPWATEWRRLRQRWQGWLYGVTPSA